MKSRKKTKKIPFYPENEIESQDRFSGYMKNNKPDNYTQKTLKCDWTDNKNCSIQYRMFIFFIRQGMPVEKIHEINSFKQNNGWKRI